MSTIRLASILAVAIFAMTLPVSGQSVISTRSGLIYYFDGFVYLDNQQLSPHQGKFSSVPQGSELRTGLGRAEVLLTPGVFLRLSDKSAIRMLENDLANTRVELQSGSTIMDSGEAISGTAVTLVFKNWQFRSPQTGTYRIDADPPHLWVLKGEVEVVPEGGAKPITVNEGMDLPLEASLVPEQSTAEPADGLSDWAKGRNDSIDADNAITQQLDADSGTSQSADLSGLSGLSYFPILGLSTAGLSYDPYTSTLPTQAGFYSVYLPGYGSIPILLRIIVRPRVPGLPPRHRVLPGVGGTVGPRPIGPRPIGPRPILPAQGPTHPVAHMAPPIARAH